MLSIARNFLPKNEDTFLQVYKGTLPFFLKNKTNLLQNGLNENQGGRNILQNMILHWADTSSTAATTEATCRNKISLKNAEKILIL